MPKDFIRCYKKNHGKVITKDLGKGKYMHICKDKNGWHEGEVKTYKKVVKKNAK